MNGLIKNEIKLFCNMKFYISILISIISVVLIHNREILPKFEYYYEDLLNSHIYNTLPIEGAILRYNEDLKTLNNQIDESEEVDEKIQAQLDLVSNIRVKYLKLEQYLKELTYNTDRLEDEEGFNSYFEMIDDFIEEEFIIPIRQEGKFYYYDGYGLSSELDWASRTLIRDYISKNNVELSRDEITSNRVIYQFLDGSNNIYVLMIVLILVILNYDIWSRDFSETNGKILYTIPYKKSKIFFTRFFLRLFLSLLVILLPLIILFLYTSVVHKVGLNDGVLVSENLFTSSFSNNFLTEKIETLEYLELHKGIPIWQYNIILLVFNIIWLSFLYGFINLVDLTFETSISTLIGGVFIIFNIIGISTIQNLNPFTFYNLKDILYGIERSGPYDFWVLDYNINYFILVILVLGIFMYLISKFIFSRRKI